MNLLHKISLILCGHLAIRFVSSLTQTEPCKLRELQQEVNLDLQHCGKNTLGTFLAILALTFLLLEAPSKSPTIKARVALQLEID